MNAAMPVNVLLPDQLKQIDAYWRAANYLSVGQIYLYDNPLLREPLTLAHVKPLVVGHWGTTPGQNFIYVHLNRIIKAHDLNVIYVAATIDPDLAEWDYGDYEGVRSADIRRTRPDWNIFRDGCPNGETPEQVMARADRLIARIRGLQGNIAVFSHGHFGQVFVARWIGWAASEGQHFALDPASLSILGSKPGMPAIPAILLWNSP